MTPDGIEALTFDVFGTVVDWRGGILRDGAALGAKQGLSADWDSMKDYWNHPTAEYRASLRSAFTPEATRSQYLQGAADPSWVSPDGSTLDDFYLARPHAEDVQLDLFTDYSSNVALYPKFQEYFRAHRPPLPRSWVT